MTVQAYSSFSQWYSEGPRATYVRVMKSPGSILNMLDAMQPAGEMSDPAVPDLVLYQDVPGGSRIRADHGGGRFDVTTVRGGLVVVAPNFALSSKVYSDHHIRSFAFPLAQWQSVLDDAVDGSFSFDSLGIYRGTFDTPTIRSKLQMLWSLCEGEGAPSRLLARAAGCEILAELCRLGGTPFAPARGGLAPWAERRCVELMRARMSEDVSLDELAAEAQLSPFHFARMFKQSLGVPPRVYLTRLRLEKACELLENTDLPVTEIAFEVGYSSNQVLARVFLKHQRMSPSDYRRAVRDPVRTVALQ
jgi:AraC family transcriptional regulator